MAGYENIKNKGFDHRSTGELREIQSRGGKSSGESRRRKADFRRTLNLLLTVKIDSPEWTPILEALGLDSTLESAVNAAMIRKALAGDVRAYEAIAKYAGQSAQTEAAQEAKSLEVQKLQEELERQRLENERLRNSMRGDGESLDDGFLDALGGTAMEDWADEEPDADV